MEKEVSMEESFGEIKADGGLPMIGIYHFGFGDKYFSFVGKKDMVVTEASIRRLMLDAGFEIAAGVRRAGREKSMTDWSEGLECAQCGASEEKLKYFPVKGGGHACQRCASKMDTNLDGEVFGDLRKWRDAD